MTLILILFLICILGFILLTSFYEELLYSISEICESLGNFIKKNTGFFTVLFIFIFFLEQLFFLLIVFLYFEVSLRLSTFISIFALIVITTATLQKFIWQYKYEFLRAMVSKITNANRIFLAEMKDLINENQVLRNQRLKK